MSGAVDVYFDFRSPYAFFAAERIARGDVALPAGVAWRWRPVSINVLLNLQAGRPPLASYTDPLAPTKRRYVFEDVQHLSAHYEIPFEVPEPLRPDTVPALTAFTLLEDNGPIQHSFRSAVFDAIWRRRLNVGDRETLTRIATETDVDPGIIDRAHDHQAQGELVARSVDLYGSNGVFGVPMFVWNDERYFGADRLDVVQAAVSKCRCRVA